MKNTFVRFLSLVALVPALAPAAPLCVYRSFDNVACTNVSTFTDLDCAKAQAYCRDSLRGEQECIPESASVSHGFATSVLLYKGVTLSTFSATRCSAYSPTALAVNAAGAQCSRDRAERLDALSRQGYPQYSDFDHNAYCAQRN